MIIDYSVRVPLREVQGALMQGHLGNYRRVYGRSAGAVDYDSWCERPFEDFIAHLDEAGVDKVVVHAKDVETTFGTKISNELIHGVTRRAPERLLFSASVDPHKGKVALQEMERSVKELGAVEVNFQLFELKLQADDPVLTPFYERLQDWGVPVGLHTGINYSNVLPMEFGNPKYLDMVACRFPELKIIACPPGWPWVMELVGCAWRHPNVYICTAPVRPKYMAKPGTGWEPLLTYGNSVIRDKLLYGTSWPLLPMARTIAEMRELPMKPEVIDGWLGGNMARLLGVG